MQLASVHGVPNALRWYRSVVILSMHPMRTSGSAGNRFHSVQSSWKATHQTVVTALTCPSSHLTTPLVSKSSTDTTPSTLPTAKKWPAKTPRGLKRAQRADASMDVSKFSGKSCANGSAGRERVSARVEAGRTRRRPEELEVHRSTSRRTSNASGLEGSSAPAVRALESLQVAWSCIKGPACLCEGGKMVRRS